MPNLLASRAVSFIALLCAALGGCRHEGEKKPEGVTSGHLADQFVRPEPYSGNPLFSGTDQNTWDKHIRERGWILRDSNGYHLWYTGYNSEHGEGQMALGYASSDDGIEWKRYPGNPIFAQAWVEDMMVVRHENVYYMFAEGRNDIAHMLTSDDMLHWREHGALDIRQTNGEPISPGPYGTPTVYIEGDVWHLFYERSDLGIWHATSDDLKLWRNVQDEPVIKMGPESYDKFGVAMNQVIKHEDLYYGFYHGTPTADWSRWNINIAVSPDLTRWTKFQGNPILEENKSSGIVVHDGSRYRLYSMHDQVHLHYPAGGKDHSK